MRCRHQQQMLLRQLITESTFCSPQRRMQPKQPSVNFDAWNMNFCNVMSFSTNLHKFRVNNLRVTSNFHHNTLNHNHNQNHLLRAIRCIHRRTINRLNIIHRNNHLYKHLSLICR